MFHFIVLLNPVFNCSKSFISLSFDKVTTETNNFISFILNVALDGATIARSASAFTVISAKTQFLDQVKFNYISQIINGIFNTLQKLLKCFSGIAAFAFVNKSLSSGVFPAIPVLYLKDSQLEERGLIGSSL